MHEPGGACGADPSGGICVRGLCAVKVGDDTFWLPTDVMAKGVVGKDRFRWASHYSDYHRYTASAKILPADGDAQ